MDLRKRKEELLNEENEIDLQTSLSEIATHCEAM